MSDTIALSPRARLLPAVAALALALQFGGCAMFGADDETAAEPDADALYERFPPGAPQDCLALRDVRKIDPVGQHTLLFYTRGGDVWRNRLDRPCPGLDRNTILSYDLRTQRLCANDLVYQLDRFGSDLRRGTACSLGRFDYLTEDQAEALKQYH